MQRETKSDHQAFAEKYISEDHSLDDGQRGSIGSARDMPPIWIMRSLRDSLTLTTALTTVQTRTVIGITEYRGNHHPFSSEKARGLPRPGDFSTLIVTIQSNQKNPVAA